MTIIEAIKSGKAFSRQGDKYSLLIVVKSAFKGELVIVYKNSPSIAAELSYVEDLLADDWEVREE